MTTKTRQFTSTIRLEIYQSSTEQTRTCLLPTPWQRWMQWYPPPPCIVSGRARRFPRTPKGTYPKTPQVTVPSHSRLLCKGRATRNKDCNFGKRTLPIGSKGRHCDCRGGRGGLASAFKLCLRRRQGPLCDIPFGCCSFTGPWTVTHSSLRMLLQVAAFCRPLWPGLFLVLFPRSRSPVVGVLGLCWM